MHRCVSVTECVPACTLEPTAPLFASRTTSAQLRHQLHKQQERGKKAQEFLMRFSEDCKEHWLCFCVEQDKRLEEGCGDSEGFIPHDLHGQGTCLWPDQATGFSGMLISRHNSNGRLQSIKL